MRRGKRGVYQDWAAMLGALAQSAARRIRLRQRSRERRLLGGSGGCRGGGGTARGNVSRSRSPFRGKPDLGRPRLLARQEGRMAGRRRTFRGRCLVAV